MKTILFLGPFFNSISITELIRIEVELYHLGFIKYFVVGLQCRRLINLLNAKELHVVTTKVTRVVVNFVPFLHRWLLPIFNLLAIICIATNIFVQKLIEQDVTLLVKDRI